MREFFETRQLSGEIKIQLKTQGQPTRVWEADKGVLVKQITDIVVDYAEMGYVLTLRQLYYQLVKANAIPNHDTVYGKLSSVLDDCRYSGKIDWDAIEDRGRVPKLPYSVKGIEDAVKDTIDHYRLNRQEGQPKHIELWTEKDAISNILFRVTAKFHVRLVINKGYTSSSAAYSAYERFVEQFQAGKSVVILYFGDHDPSGLDMIRDIRERMLTFFTQGERLKEKDSFFEKACETWWLKSKNSIYELNEGGYLDDKTFMRIGRSDDQKQEDVDAYLDAVVRMYIDEHKLFQIIPIGLTEQQIKEYNLPPNPAKITDPRAKNYIAQFGRQSWEVDALRPDVLAKLVEDSILGILDVKQFNKIIKLEKSQVAELKKFVSKK